MKQYTAPTSIRFSHPNKEFIIWITKIKKISESEAINFAVDLLRKAKLSEEMTEEATENPEQDAILAEAGMQNYHQLIKDAESI